MIVHLNGWPGAGKKTIGETLSKMLDARFIHNHLLHDVAIVCAGFESEYRWELYETIRSAAYKVLARHPPMEIFVMTNALCNDFPREELAWKHVVELAITRDVPLVPVVLEISNSENIRRLQSPDRIGQKMTDVAALRQWFDKYSIQRPDVPELIVVDVSDLSPEQAADTILVRLNLLRPALQPATLQHLQMMR
jgi:gluconate kinase